MTKPIRSAQFFECLAAVFSEAAESSARAKSDFVAHRQTLVTRHSLREAKSKIDGALASFDEKSFPILVVEDNEINRRLLLRQLEQIGARAVDTAVDGRAALEKLALKNYRLIFMDCQMPRLDGYETTREVRRLERAEKTGAPAAIVALTAHTLAGEREKCLAAGMNDYLSKPVKIKELAATIQFWSQSPDEKSDDGEPFETKENVSAPARPNFDFKLLRELAENSDDANFAGEIFNLYLDETDRRLDELRSACESGDCPALTRIAHALRGNSLAVGAFAVAEIAARIEQLSGKNNVEEARRRLPELADAFSEIQTEMLELSEKW